MKLTIGWLYPKLMNTYGDRGNIICLQKRCEWRKIDVEIKYLDVGFDHKQLAMCDMLFMGGAQDKQQQIVAKDFDKKKTQVLKEIIENGKPGLYICGAYQFLGKYYKEANGNKIPGLAILDLYTENEGKERLIGNVVVEIYDLRFKIYDQEQKNIRKSSIVNHKSYAVGFENHGGRTYLGKDLQPLGNVSVGYGNNGEDNQEGVIYKNTIGTYLHGPILPKNPYLADFLIKTALEQKYKTNVELRSLNDELELNAQQAIAKRLRIEI